METLLAYAKAQGAKSIQKITGPNGAFISISKEENKKIPDLSKCIGDRDNHLRGIMQFFVFDLKFLCMLIHYAVEKGNGNTGRSDKKGKKAS